MKVYCGLGQWHAITQCGVKLRMGKSLKKVWETWRRIYLGAEVRLGNVDGVEQMTFMATHKVRSRGKDDIKCELVE